MKYYQIYVKHVRLDGTKAKKFRKAGFQNRFFNIYMLRIFGYNRSVQIYSNFFDFVFVRTFTRQYI